MSNINAIHQHLQNTFPKSMTMPEFWCETNHDGTLRLFYYSSRGSFLAPLAVGLVREVARLQFELDIVMTQVTTQGKEGSRFTSWMVDTSDPKDTYKLTSKLGRKDGVENDPTDFPMPLKCPMTGVEFNLDEMVVTKRRLSLQSHISTSYSEDLARPCPSRMKMESPKPGGCPYQQSLEDHDRLSPLSTIHSRSSGLDCHLAFRGAMSTAPPLNVERGGISASAVRTIFPYHVLIDQDFCIRQVGNELPKVLGTTESILYEHEIDDIFEFVKPKPAKWTRSWLRKLLDQEFVLECSLDSMPSDILFKGTWIPSAGPNGVDAFLILCPDAKNLEELREMSLTLSDLPAHGAYRDAVFLREHLSRQMNNALQMEKLSKRLQTEKTLLESLLPVHAAEGLRRGQEVKPMIHNSVTMFFSDIVGFTSICKEISPWQVINMLNQLYGIMDYLAGKFSLFKVETIGDAYVCGGGLATEDSNHAVNVANFAVAVQHFCRKVLSPVDKQPIQLRIGIHSGEAASGIVGVTNPRYCVFGDTVNTTARHESTGEPGRVHCSQATMMELTTKASNQFKISSRGMVEMKGKGLVQTYWVESSSNNELTCESALLKLDEYITKISLPKGNPSQVERTCSLERQNEKEENMNPLKLPMTLESTTTRRNSIKTSDTVDTEESISSRSDDDSLHEGFDVIKDGELKNNSSSEHAPSLSHFEIVAMVATERKSRIERAMQQTQALLARKSKK
jgi:class 3 adenylate cyclase